VNWQTVGYWASLRAATPLASDDGLNFLRLNGNNVTTIDHPGAFNFTNWEIGNEVYGSWEMDEHGTGGDALPMPAGDTLAAHDPTTIVSFSKQFQTAINSILTDGFESSAHAISIGIDSQDPNNASTNGFGPNTDGNWISDVLTQSVAQGFTLGYVADHYYTSVGPGSENDATLLATPNSTTGSNPYGLTTRINDYDNLIHTTLGSAGNNVSVLIDEFNSVSSDPGKESVSIVNGLFVADGYGAALDTTGSDGLGGAQGIWVWVLHNGTSNGNKKTSLYGWRTVGDYGILGDGSAYATNELSPDYMAMDLVSKFAQSGGSVVSSTLDTTNKIDSYAIMEPNGHLELLVINKNPPGGTPPTNTPPPTISETFNIAGFTPSGAALIYQYGVAEDDAQDLSSTKAASLTQINTNLSITSGSFTYSVPDYTMMVFDLSPQTGPTVTQAAAANPSPVTGTTTSLSALGSENGSGAGLNYTWSATSVLGGVATPTYSINGTNASSTTTATFFGAGSYTFLVTITDASNNSVTSSVNVTVNQTLNSIVVSPSSTTINEDSNQSFSASGKDQFNVALTSQPTFTWSVTNGIGSVNASALYSSPTASGSATVQAAVGGIHGSASVTINNATPTVAQAASANANPVTTTSTALSALGADDGGEANLSYSWSDTGPSGVTYTGNTNGNNAAKNITANFTQAGSYNFTVTITDSGGLFTTSSIAVNVQQTPTGVIVTPSTATVAPGAQQQFAATATDQFGNAISSPTFNWQINGTGNSIDTTGLAMLGSTAGTYTVTATLGSASNIASVTVAVAPIVSAFQVNDGSVQRSMVDSLTVTFNEPVTLSAGAITLNLLSQTGGASTPITNFNLTSPDGGTTWMLTFTDPSYIGHSLPDGAYELSVSASGVSSGGLNMSADQNFTFWRLYGDFGGDGTVNGSDFTQLVTLIGKAAGSSNWYVDYDADGVIGGSDFTAFVTRLGHSISIPSLPSVVLLAAAPPVATLTTPTTTASTTNKTLASTTAPAVTVVTKPAGRQKPRHGHR
jgi:hypothetical protein